jgi:hypothetical protein
MKPLRIAVVACFVANLPVDSRAFGAEANGIPALAEATIFRRKSNCSLEFGCGFRFAAATMPEKIR